MHTTLSTYMNRALSVRQWPYPTFPPSMNINAACPIWFRVDLNRIFSTFRSGIHSVSEARFLTT